MPPRAPPKGNKVAAKNPLQDALDKANAVDDVVDDELKKSLRMECRELEKRIEQEDKLGFMYNDERIRVSYFWMVGKKELEDVDAQLRNKDREIQDLKEKHQIEVKIYMQRLMHLMF